MKLTTSRLIKTWVFAGMTIAAAIALALALGTTTNAQEPPSQTTPTSLLEPASSPAKPHYETETTKINAGPGNAKIPFSFHLKNTGGRPLKIIAIKPDCGCTTIDDLTNQEVAPNQSIEIKGLVSPNPTLKTGTETKRIYVTTNPGGIKILTVEIAKGDPKLYATPSQLHWERGSSDSKEIVVTNKTGGKVTTRSLGQVHAEVLEENGETLRLKITPTIAPQPPRNKHTLGVVIIESESKKDKIFVRINDGPPSKPPLSPEEISKTHQRLEIKKNTINKLESLLKKLREEVKNIEETQ